MNYDKNTAKLIWDYFTAKGLNAYAVAGVLGNLYAESGLRSNNLQNSYEIRLNMTDSQYTEAVDSGKYTDFCTDKAGYGLAQWTSSGRKTGLYNYIKSLGCSISDINAQLNYLWSELNGAYKKKVLDVLLTAGSVRESAEIFVTKYEIPASVLKGGTSKENTINTRAEYAQEFYNLFAKDEVKTMGLKIAIDAGHYKNTSGKRCMKAIDPNETREWFLNDRIADKLQTLLQAYDCEYLRVDDPTGDTEVLLSERVKRANDWGADIYISIHHNAGVNGGSGGGTVVFCYKNKDNIAQAQALYNAIIAETQLIGNRYTRVDSNNNLYVIVNTKAPAFLIENGFMDSKVDTPIILTEAHADKTARGILNWLIGTWGLKAKSQSAPVVNVPESNVIYRVQVGAFSSKANAENLLAQLKAKGFEGVVVSGNK